MAAQLGKWVEKGFISNYTLWNRRNPDADPKQCGIYRPDFVFEWAEGVLILEYDEQMHSDRVKRCELVRMAEISLGYGGRPVHWIRFNPDAFKVADKTLRMRNENRYAELLKLLEKHLNNADYGHFITINYVCYDKPENSENDLIQTFEIATIEDYETWVNERAPADVVPADV